MKITLAMVACALIVFGHTEVHGGPQAYVGLYVDEDRVSWCASGEPVYTLELWVWALPADSGLSGVSFYMSEPEGITYGDYNENPNLDIKRRVCKEKPCPWSFPFLDCQTDWVWLMHETLFIDSTDPMAIELLPVDPADGDVVTVWDCDNNEHFGVKLSNLYINHDPGSPECMGLSVAPASWGAIKRLIEQ